MFVEIVPLLIAPIVACLLIARAQQLAGVLERRIRWLRRRGLIDGRSSSSAHVAVVLAALNARPEDCPRQSTYQVLQGVRCALLSCWALLAVSIAYATAIAK